MVISAAEVLVRYVRFIPAENELLVALLSSFLYELPVCVCVCLWSCLCSCLFRKQCN